MEEASQALEKRTLIKGPWSPEEDRKLIAYINRYGIWNWKEMAKPAGLQRSGKSCRLRWVNYLKPGIKRGNFRREEEKTIIELHERLGNRWSVIASRLPGRTDNEIKNYWHTRLSKRLKYNSVATSGLCQVSNVETEHKSSSEIDLPVVPPANTPKASNSNSESCGAIIFQLQQVSPQVSSDILSASASTSSYKNQATEETNIGSSETFGELQSILEKPMMSEEGSDTAEKYGVSIASAHQLLWFRFQERMYQANSCDDVWLNPLMKENIYALEANK